MQRDWELPRLSHRGAMKSAIFTSLLTFFACISVNLLEAQQVEFVKSFDVQGSALFPQGVALDATGVYVAGEEYCLTYPCHWGSYLYKYDRNGNQLWGRHFLFDQRYFLYQVWGIAADDTGVYISGAYHSSYPTHEENYSFLTKLDADGNVLWTRGSGIASRAKVAVDSTGVYLSSYPFLAKFDHNGNKQWERTAQGPGLFGGIATYGRYIYIAAGSSIHKYDAYGNEIWEVATDGNHGISVNAEGIYSSFNDHISLYSHDGAMLWSSRRLAYPHYYNLRSIATSPEGGVVFTYSGVSPATTARWGLFVSSYDAAGNELWAYQVPDCLCSQERLGGVAVDASGIYTAAEYGYTNLLIKVTGSHTPPTITSLLGPSGPLVLGVQANMTVNFTDADAQDLHTCRFNWDGSSTSTGAVTEPTTSSPGICTGAHTYSSAGVYTVGVTVTDNTGASAFATYQFIVIYNPSAGFITGGGWIDSPAGAYRPDVTLTGKANFGFVSKYHRGATIPDGQTEFQFKAGNFNFRSSDYEWLVIIVAGAKAQYKGSGTVNGAGNYGFLLTATDGQLPGGGGVDKLRLKVWDKTTDEIVYDNVYGAPDDVGAANPQAIGGGSISIHSN